MPSPELLETFPNPYADREYEIFMTCPEFTSLCPLGGIESDADELAPLVGPAELICSNILRSVNTMLLPMIVRVAAPGATLIFAGMEEPEAELFRPVLEQHHLVVLDEVRDGGWWSVAARVR